MILFYSAYNIRDESKIRLDNSRQYEYGFKGTTFVIAIRELFKFLNNKIV